MAVDIPPIRFSDNQRRQLEKHGLTAQQIATLEGHACPLGKLFLAKPQRIADVRDWLVKVREQLVTEHTPLSELLSEKQTEARKEALLHICEAAVRLGLYKIIEMSPIPPDALSKIFDAALRGLQYQTHHRAANPRPVQLIWHDLIDTHDRTRDSQGRRRANKIHLSWSPKSPFREIVGICYEAMTGREGLDPERALKDFVRWQKKREDQQRHEIGITKDLAALGIPASAGGRGRPRKTLAIPKNRI